MKKIIKSLHESDLLIKDVRQTIKNEVKEKKESFKYLLGILGATLLWNLLACKGTNRAGEGTIRAAEATIRACQDF